MEFNSHQIKLLRTPGEAYNMKTCFSARDEHFDCMDRFKNLKGEENHYRCPDSLTSWKVNCGPGIWRIQMEDREYDIKDRYLYTEEQLKEYNRRKNDVSDKSAGLKSFSQGKL